MAAAHKCCVTRRAALVSSKLQIKAHCLKWLWMSTAVKQTMPRCTKRLQHDEKQERLRNLLRQETWQNEQNNAYCR